MTKKSAKTLDSEIRIREQKQEKMTAPTMIEKTKITLSITQEDRDAVKMYALKNHTTVSDLLHEWIQINCQD